MKKIRIIIYLLLFIFMIIFGLHISSRVFIPKWLDNKDNMHTWISRGFYEEEKNSLDVLFLGNSDVYRGISPIILWDDHGIASYAYQHQVKDMEYLLYVKRSIIISKTKSSCF